MLNGRDREDLLKVFYPEGNNEWREQILTDAELEGFDGYSMEPDWLKSMNDLWISRLMEDKYNVFYSAPLDLDFLMLETFPEPYKKQFLEARVSPIGPIIPRVTARK